MLENIRGLSEKLFNRIYRKMSINGGNRMIRSTTYFEKISKIVLFVIALSLSGFLISRETRCCVTSPRFTNHRSNENLRIKNAVKKLERETRL
jgi:hypothetical protein